MSKNKYSSYNTKKGEYLCIHMVIPFIQLKTTMTVLVVGGQFLLLSLLFSSYSGVLEIMAMVITIVDKNSEEAFMPLRYFNLIIDKSLYRLFKLYRIRIS